jgi:hypothetical protein
MVGGHEGLHTLGQAAANDEVCGSETLIIELLTTCAVSKGQLCFLKAKDE